MGNLYFHQGLDAPFNFRHRICVVPVTMANGLKLAFSLLLVLSYAMPTGHFHDMLVPVITSQSSQFPAKTHKPSKRKGILVQASNSAVGSVCDDQRLAQSNPDCVQVPRPVDSYSFFCSDTTLEILLPPPRARA